MGEQRTARRLSRATRGNLLFLATVALGGFAFLGGTMAESSMREPSTLLAAAGMLAALGAVLWFGRPTDVERLERENADYRALFAMQWDRYAEAADRWRAEDPQARALSMPDLGDLLRWLMADADTARTAAIQTTDQQEGEAGAGRA